MGFPNLFMSVTQPVHITIFMSAELLEVPYDFESWVSEANVSVIISS